MNLPIAPLAATVLGIAAAAGAALMPTARLESLVMGSGIPAILAAAEPPLGVTARLAIASGLGVFVALFSWFGLFLVLGTRSFGFRRADTMDETIVHTPVVRRADAHPDAPPRPPLLATRDLGTPFLEVRARGLKHEAVAAPLAISELEPAASVAEVDEVDTCEPLPIVSEPRFAPIEQALPQDLDQPLAAFDPAAIPYEAAPLPEAVTPLRRAPRPAVFEATERFETFELTPRVRPTEPWSAPRGDAITKPETEATIHALLERLEKGVVRRGLASEAPPARRPRDAERGLEDALVTLRNLARRA